MQIPTLDPHQHRAFKGKVKEAKEILNYYLEKSYQSNYDIYKSSTLKS
jgi:predicted SAM-dependent methyltransferase